MVLVLPRRLEMDFGERVKELRELRNWTQGDLGDRAGGYSKSYISQIESSTRPPSGKVQRKLAEAFNLPQYLLLHPSAPTDRLAEISEILEQVAQLDPDQIEAVSQMIRAFQSSRRS